MAINTNFTVVTQYPTVEFLGGTQTRDVTAVGYITAGHGVYFEARIPQTVYSAAQVKDYGIGYSGTIEQVFEWTGVVGCVWSQTPNAANVLVDQLTLTVQSASGNSQANHTILLTDIGFPAGEPAIEKLYNELNTAEGITG